MTQVREEQNCFQQTKWFPGFLFWYKKTVMSKKKVFPARNLEDCFQVYHSKQDRKKRNSTILCVPDHLLDVVYYESIKRDLNIKPTCECRCDGRLQTKTKRFTRLSYTGLVVELEHLKIKCVFICNWIKKRREPRANNVTLKLGRIREADKDEFFWKERREKKKLICFFSRCRNKRDKKKS